MEVDGTITALRSSRVTLTCVVSERRTNKKVGRRHSIKYVKQKAVGVTFLFMQLILDGCVDELFWFQPCISAYPFTSPASPFSVPRSKAGVFRDVWICLLDGRHLAELPMQCGPFKGVLSEARLPD
jgi:hypothetical protein